MESIANNLQQYEDIRKLKKVNNQKQMAQAMFCFVLIFFVFIVPKYFSLTNTSISKIIYVYIMKHYCWLICCYIVTTSDCV